MSTPADREIAALEGILGLVDSKHEPAALLAEVRCFALRRLSKAKAARIPRSIADLAEELHVSEQTVRRRIRGRAPWLKVGGRFGPFPVDVLDILS